MGFDLLLLLGFLPCTLGILAAIFSHLMLMWFKRKPKVSRGRFAVWMILMLCALPVIFWLVFLIYLFTNILAPGYRWLWFLTAFVLMFGVGELLARLLKIALKKSKLPIS